mmetsp:Transcript_32398/g.47240  ORF Transcript_32398/g.47240 Transcript_32398/m.47240 type:complete len:92 (+) Transcript_32398:1726-2001(+)|eukprot:4592089-Ditylum_brightwellii.AAC.2
MVFWPKTGDLVDMRIHESNWPMLFFVKHPPTRHRSTPTKQKKDHMKMSTTLSSSTKQTNASSHPHQPALDCYCASNTKMPTHTIISAFTTE